MTNRQISRILSQTARLMELVGEDAYRTRALETAARTVERSTVPVTLLLAEERLTELPGIGKGLAAQIRQVVETGTFDARDNVLARVPPGVAELLRLRGLGPSRLRQAWTSLGLQNLDDLEAVALSGALAALPGWGKRSAASLLSSIAEFRYARSRRRYADVLPTAEAMLAALPSPSSLCGEIRRACEVLTAVELITTAPAYDVMVLLADHLQNQHLIEDAIPFIEGALADGFPTRIYLAPAASFGSRLWRLTGSSVHVKQFEARFGAPSDVADEQHIYAGVGLPCIPPELREGRDEIGLAERNALPDLIEVTHLRGSLHNHSTYSDGSDPLHVMAEAARDRGYAYFSINDHSRSLTIANGLSVEQLLAQIDEVRALNETMAPFRVFSGTECDILADGSLDFPDDLLARLDVVVASIHTGFEMSEAQATERLLTAIRNPNVHILGHPTARLLLGREGYPIDHARIIDACAEHGVALELNANPRRLDVDWRYLPEVVTAGVPVAINPDAHWTGGLDDVRWGVAAARKGGLRVADCLNTLDVAAFESWLAAHHRRVP